MKHFPVYWILDSKLQKTDFSGSCSFCHSRSVELTKQLPVLSDADFLPDLHQAVKDETEWSCPGIAAVLRFAWALMLRNVAQQPEVDG